MRNPLFKQRKHIIWAGIALLICIIYLIFIRDVDIEGWERGVDRRLASYIEKDGGSDWGLSGRSVCPCSSRVVVAVHSAPSNHQLRSAIRMTWGITPVNSTKVKVLFIVGQVADQSLQRVLEDENEVWKDMVQGNFLDTYNNLTLKTVWTIKWYLRQCNASSVFLVKADDDLFLHLPKLVRLLELVSPKGVLRGTLFQKPYVIRNHFDKWYCPKYLYNGSYYPDFLSGTAYLMSRDIALRLYQAAFDVPLFHLEDVYMTGLCAVRAGVRRKALEGFSIEQHLMMRCDTDLLSLHHQTPEQIRDNWSVLRACPG